MRASETGEGGTVSVIPQPQERLTLGAGLAEAQRDEENDQGADSNCCLELGRLRKEQQQARLRALDGVDDFPLGRT